MASKAVEHLKQAESFADKADECCTYDPKRSEIFAQLAIAHAQIAIAYKTIIG